MKKLLLVIVIFSMLLVSIPVAASDVTLTSTNYLLNNERLSESYTLGVPNGKTMLLRAEGSLTIADIGFQGTPNLDLAMYASYLQLAQHEEEIWRDYPPEEQSYYRRDDLQDYIDEKCGQQNPFAPNSGIPGVPSNMTVEIQRLDITPDGKSVAATTAASIPISLLSAGMDVAICGVMGTNTTLKDGVYVIIPPKDFFSSSAMSMSMFMTGSGKIKVMGGSIVDAQMMGQLAASKHGLGIIEGDAVTEQLLTEYMKEVEKVQQADRAAQAAADKAKAAAAANAPIKLVVDGKTIKTPVAPIIEKGSTLVPLRSFVEAIGYSAIWVPESNSIIITAYGGEPLLEMTINSQYAYSYIYDDSGVRVVMEVPPRLIKGTTMVPARFIAETFACHVSWDQKTKTVTINRSLG